MLIDDLICDLSDRFNMTSSFVDEVNGGWKNRKWKVSTGKKNLLIKELSKERYNDTKLLEVKKSLNVQQKSHVKFGVAPSLLFLNDRCVFNCAGINYLVMEYHEGEHRDNSSINKSELFTLGRALAQVHSLEIDGIYNSDETQENHFEILIEYIHTIDINAISQNVILRDAINKVKSNILKVDSGFLKEMRIGYTHSDFAKDNILFTEKGVKILDFDRGRINYQLQDVGRAIMSFAFSGQKLEISKIQEFMSGYNTISGLDKVDMINSLKLIWTIEVVWWFNSDSFDGNASIKVSEFKREIMYLNDNLCDLEQLLRDLK